MSNQVSSSRLPERIGRLLELARNLWWSWHPQARALFRALDYSLWRTDGHNPVKQLGEISSDALEVAAADPDFLALYDSVLSAFDADMSAHDTWFSTHHPHPLPGPVAYFSMEFAIHNSLPIYAGGLGILAGDICKEASDLGIHLVGVGVMCPQGYFHQRISADGWQEETYRQLDFDKKPVEQLLSGSGKKVLAEVQLDNRVVSVGVWRVRVGRVSVYLLDTNVDENTAQDRQLFDRLYIADQEIRIQQEIVLGIGVVRVLRALNIEPAVWHANEGHTAFMMLERLGEELERGIGFTEALRRVREATVFTTHTPVPASQDILPVSLVVRYLRPYFQSLGIDLRTFLELGRHGSDGGTFDVVAFALKMADRRNGVSQLHSTVARKTWHGLWPEVAEDDVPISWVTNGIHVPTWIAPELARLYGKYLGEDWITKHDEEELWERVLDIPDEELWATHQLLKRKLIVASLERAQKAWAEENATAEQVLAMGALLDPAPLTIGFIRRFTEYKRPALILRDVPRLKRIVRDPWRPVQIVFAGKSHPADLPSKHLLHQVYSLATDREFQGRIAFVEDYNMHMARYFTHGVDVWLNTPRRLQEACGTSGIKASLNGVLHLSIRDGWWHEGYNGANGWVINDVAEPPNPGEVDDADAKALYQLLEEEIVPLYYERDLDGVPHGWIRLMKEAIRSVVPRFCSRRMLKEYTRRVWAPAPRG